MDNGWLDYSVAAKTSLRDSTASVSLKFLQTSTVIILTIAVIPVGPGVTLAALFFVAILPVVLSTVQASIHLRRAGALSVVVLVAAAASNAVHVAGLRGLFSEFWIILLTPLAIFGYYWLIEQMGQHAVVVGSLTGVIIYRIVSTREFALVYLWKFGVAAPASVLLLYLVSRRTRPKILLAVVTVLLTVVHLLADFRSAAALTTLAYVVCYAQMLSGKSSNKPQSWSRILIAPVAVVAIVLIASLYGSLAAAGQLSVGQQEKYIQQSQGYGGVLIAGRPEIVVSTTVLSRNLLLGLGGKPKVNLDDAQAAMSNLADLGQRTDAGAQSWYWRDGINTHSIIFHSAVRFGVAALVFWIAILVLLGRELIKGIKDERFEVNTGIALWVLFLLWDLLFSPWTPGYEVFLGVGVAAVVNCCKEGKVYASMAAEGSDPARISIATVSESPR